MKKLLFGAAALLLIVSCSGNGASEKANDDSARISDSIAQVEAAKAAAEQARLDSLRQDSIAQAEESAKVAAQYDKLISQYVDAVNQYGKLRRGNDWEAMNKASQKYMKLEKQISKIKGNLNSEQLAKFKQAKATALKWEDYN